MSTEDDAQRPLCPPENFAMVWTGIYRSAFPSPKNFPFLKRIGIRTIVCLVLEDYPGSSLDFLKSIHARLLRFGVAGNKEPFVDIDEEVIRNALRALLDERNHPILIHCNKGKHRTGCLVGVFRKTLQWSMTSIFDEYRRFANPKARSCDLQFIEGFQLHTRPIPLWRKVKVEQEKRKFELKRLHT